MELQRLRRVGLADLAHRRQRYPRLLAALERRAGPLPADLLGGLAYCSAVWSTVLGELPDARLRNAAEILFHSAHYSTPPTLDDRRRAADQAFHPREYAREPDTIQRTLERQLLDPLLVEILLRDPARPAGVAVLAGLDLEDWADDLDRAHVAVGRQDWSGAGLLLDRWLGHHDLNLLGEHGVQLRARSLLLSGHMRRDQGRVAGPLSAEHAYRTAKELFTRLGQPRRVAQADLLLTVTREMTGHLALAARRYAELANDPRLGALDRAHARLWVGTALTKNPQPHLLPVAVSAIEDATRVLEDLGEPDEWSIATQKLALAYRAAGKTGAAVRHIEIALAHRPTDSPLQQVRLDTAHGHILLSDPATAEHGYCVLASAEATAGRYGLSHQVRAIQGIRAGSGRTARTS
ncbi:hypothetical protein AB0M43_34705 [Longispora sp. NPDC051575]|uniref:hypothetical protein n=1 Tax=Longispora sp. NPDC051575 TaxID=3154943 RepID=UPI0034373B07